MKFYDIRKIEKQRKTMTSQESFANLNIHFIVPEKYDSEEECSEEMWEAYNLCTQNEFQPRWIEEKKSLSMKAEKTDVFIMEEFQGAAFEKFSTSKCLIVGPRCIMSCFLSGEPIPEGNSPIFTTAMRGIIICATGLRQEVKANIEKKVEYMGGMFMKQLRGCVTHLISDSVMSVKYEKAIERGIPVLTDGWIDAIWETNMKSFVKADDPRFDGYKCPVFMNLVVTTTNLSKQHKEETKRLINEHGGTFMGALDGTRVKVVLAPTNSPLTDKLKYAKQNNIACLDVDWVTKSISAGYALPFTEYLIKSTKGSSTPEQSQAPMLNFSIISAITEPRCTKNFIEETMMTTMNSTNIGDNTTSVDRQSLAPYIERVERLDFRQAKLAGPFLDGCNIYLAGFPTNHRDKINRILNAGSATRLNDISDALTHVLVGDTSKAAIELKLMQTRGLNPYILGLDWLEESLRLQRPAPEENFIREKKQSTNDKTAEPPSPLSKKNLQMLQRPKRPPVPQFDVDQEMTTADADESENEASLVQQYLQKADTDSNTAELSFQKLVKQKNSSIKEATTIATSVSGISFNVSKTCEPEEMTKDLANDSAVPYSQSITDRIFEGLTFLVTGFDAEEGSIVTQNIAVLGGQIVSNSFVGVPDYGVVPLVGTVLKHTVNEIVTDLFIEDCIDHDKLVELTYYHRPLSISPDAKPLTDLVIATSTYAGIERTYLTKVANALGAKYQDTFARKTHPEKNHLGSTHLLCPLPEGNKYNAAVKWKLPAVTSGWLIACATETRRVDETPYLVGETMAPERFQNSVGTPNMGPPSALNSRTILTPKRHFPQLQGQATPVCETPLINKRLSLAMSKTPQSSFHVATPQTPYGRIFKDDPSPQTRKEWVQWVDSFPDMRVEEPPMKKRASSTPLSAIREQFWQKIKEPIGSDKDDKVFEQQPASVSRDKTLENVSIKANNKDENPLESSSIAETPINRKLSFAEESLGPKQPIDLQIEQLDQLLQATTTTAESRYSLSGNAKVYEQPIETIDKCLVKDSQPDTVGWDDPARQRRISHKPIEPIDEPIEENAPSETSRKLKFMLSGAKDRMNYENLILKLGGELSKETNYDPTATHLLCLRPARNEKMLGSIAAGKWVLHCKYLHDCGVEGKFIDEEKYEWGNPLSQNMIPQPNNDTERSIAAAVHKWRLKLHREPGGAFREMVAILFVQKEKYDQFERLIKAGGGTVVQAKAPYDSSPGGKKVTHCFIQLNKVDQPVDWAMLASKGILCFQPQYLSDYLTAETTIKPRDLVIPEFKKYFSLLPR